MENNSKSYSLVAWTEKGQLRMVPSLVDELMHTKGLRVEVLSTDAVWFGVTYKEDKEYVSAELKKLHDAGVYPEAL